MFNFEFKSDLSQTAHHPSSDPDSYISSSSSTYIKCLGHIPQFFVNGRLCDNTVRFSDSETNSGAHYVNWGQGMDK